MQQAGQALQQAQQQLAQAGQDGAPGGGQAMAGGDGYGAGGMPSGGKGGKKGRGLGGQVGMMTGSEAGHGTTNQRQGGGLMGYNTPRNRQAAERSRMRTQFERIYAPERVASQRIDTQVRGKKGGGKSDFTTVRGAPERSDAYQPYYEVYSSYRRAAEDALSKEDVPATYRKQVRDYFESLQP